MEPLFAKIDLLEVLKMQNFMVFCTNLQNMGMILERQGIMTGKNYKPGMGKYGDGEKTKTGDGESTGMGKNQKTGMGMGIPVGERGSPSPLQPYS